MMAILHQKHLVIPWGDLEKVSPVTLRSISQALEENRQPNASMLLKLISIAIEHHQKEAQDEEQNL